MEGVAIGSSKKMIATLAEMVEARVPIPYRDQCAHLLIPLNKCRQSELYLPWKCDNERHSYEKCEYELVMERILQMQKIREKQESHAKSKQQGIPLNRKGTMRLLNWRTRDPGRWLTNVGVNSFETLLVMLL